MEEESSLPWYLAPLGLIGVGFAIYFFAKWMGWLTGQITDAELIAGAIWWVGTSIANSIDTLSHRASELVDIARAQLDSGDEISEDEEDF